MRVPFKEFMVCPACGRGAQRRAFTRGALGVRLQVLRQEFVGYGNGPKGGGITWHRRAMTPDETETVARALATAGQSVAQHLEFEEQDPEEILAQLPDGEALALSVEWLKELDEEHARVRALVEADLHRRGLAHGG